MSVETTVMEPISVMQDENRIQVLFEGLRPVEFVKPQGVEKDDKRLIAFNQVNDLVNSENWTQLLSYIRPSESLGDLIDDDMAVEGLVMSNGRVKFHGFSMRNSLTQAIVKETADTIRAQEKLTANSRLKSLVHLLATTIQNSRKEIVDSMYDFVSENKVMHKNGKLISLFVAVDSDGKHNGHTIEDGWEMPSNMVSSKTQVAVGSYNAVASRKPSDGGKVMRVVVDPKDIVSVSGSTLVVSRISQVGKALSEDTWEE